MFPESLIHVLPCFNGEVERFVTTYRCEGCRAAALDETRTRLAKTEDWAGVTSLVECFERHGVFLLEFRRGDPLPVVRALLEQTIELLRRGAIRLTIGPIEPASEVEALISDMKMNEKLAEAAYSAMYDASSAAVKDCVDDARGYFAKAIDMARRAGVEDEVARLTARRDHVVRVYDSQFRGLR
jgi:hypothetical protein